MCRRTTLESHSSRKNFAYSYLPKRTPSTPTPSSISPGEMQGPSLPRTGESAPLKHLSSKNESEGGQQRLIQVLVADDDRDLLKIYCRALLDNGFDVMLATTGNDAVSRFIESRPEVIILDYRMPQGNGLEAAGQILAMKPSAKIIMLTADGTVLEEAERIGIELFLEKPISLKRLLESVYTLVKLKPTSALVSR